MRFVFSSMLVVCACASTTEEAPPPDGAGGSMGGNGPGGSNPTGGGEGGAAPGFIPQSCEAGQFATGLDGAGMLQCAAITDIGAAMNAGCSLYSGFRDSCNGCTNPPVKWGGVSADACNSGVGTHNVCIAPVLGGDTVQLFGLNLDGDVNDDDKLYLGLSCRPLGESALPGPCEAGEHAVRLTPDGVAECVPDDRAVTAYVRNHCSLYHGWADTCEGGCVTAPDKWGRMSGTSCEIGAGGQSSCGAHFLDAHWVTQIAINTDGDVNDDDKMYLALHCETGAADPTTAAGRCPPGQLIVGVREDGDLECASPAPDIAAVVRADCFAYLGYRDGCDGCTSDPSKWGRVSTASCEVGAGGDNDCISVALGGTTVEMLGINLDGDVDGNDVLYSGLRCF